MYQKISKWPLLRLNGREQTNMAARIIIIAAPVGFAVPGFSPKMFGCADEPLGRGAWLGPDGAVASLTHPGASVCILHRDLFLPQLGKSCLDT